MKRLSVYTLPNCKECKKIKQKFKSRGIDYNEVDMSIGGRKQVINRKKQFKELGFRTYPIIIIEEENDEELIYPKMNDKELKEILEIMNG